MAGPGAVFSFGVKGGLEAGKALINALKLATLAVSLGGVETLVEHPASMTHTSMPRAQREAAGITDDLVRLAVGCEDVRDLIADLSQALSLVERSAPSLVGAP
jgi:methionine-gamma-lyase